LSIGPAVFWLHHPLNVGTRSPTLIRRRLINGDTTDTPAAATRLAGRFVAMSFKDTRKVGPAL